MGLVFTPLLKWPSQVVIKRFRIQQPGPKRVVLTNSTTLSKPFCVFLHLVPLPKFQNDRYITKEWRFLKLIRPGDEIMADRGFLHVIQTFF